MTDGPYPNHLSAFMHASGLTDPGLANALGISKQQIFNLRRGHRKLTVEWAKRLAPHLGISWQELITGSPPEPSDQTQADLLAAYAAMTEEQRQALLTMANLLASAANADTAKPEPMPRPAATHATPVPLVRGRR